MHSLDILTINENPRGKEDLLEMIWNALNYFPEGTWGNINYIGNTVVKYDLTVEANGELSQALTFPKILRKLREMRGMFKTHTLLLGVTHDPVIVLYCRFEGNSFKRSVVTVHDYVSDDVGILSFFQKDESVAIRIVAHGLGHNRGLEHHNEPIDLMFIGLLDGGRIELDGFCRSCIRKLRSRATQNTTRVAST